MQPNREKQRLMTAYDSLVPKVQLGNETYGRERLPPNRNGRMTSVPGLGSAGASPSQKSHRRHFEKPSVPMKSLHYCIPPLK